MLVIVGGVSGSGKTTLCSHLAPAVGARHVTASELLAYRPQARDKTRKAVRNLVDDQNRIVQAFRMQRLHAEDVILDGHFALFDQRGELMPIPLEVFVAFRPNALILVDAGADEISRRLSARGDHFELKLIKGLAEAERSQAVTVSERLSIPLLEWMSGSRIDLAIDFVRSSASTS